MGWEWAWFEIKLILVNVPLHIQTYVAIVGWGYCCLIKTIDVLMKYVCTLISHAIFKRREEEKIKRDLFNLLVLTF